MTGKDNNKKQKTNAVRILVRMKIKYTLDNYEVDENDLPAVHLAESSGLYIDRILKSLVLNPNQTG